MIYQRGDVSRLDLETKNEAGELTNPGKVVFRILAPNGTKTVREYPGPEIVHDATGKFHADVELTEAGTWHYRWETSEGITVSKNGELQVESDPFAPRPLARLIADLRLMTTAPEGLYEVNGRSYWSDADLERKLENRVGERLVQVHVEMAGRIELTGEGTSSRLALKDGKVDFAGTLDTETAEVTTFWGGPLEGKVTLYGDGRIEFEKSQLAKTPLLTGTTYDLYGAAADVLTDWASAVKLGYDISTDNQELKRSERHAQLLEQAEAFRKQALIGSVKMARTDMMPGRSGRTKAILESFDRWGLYPQSTPSS